MRRYGSVDRPFSAATLVRPAEAKALSHLLRDKPGRRSAAKLLTRDDARRIVTVLQERHSQSLFLCRVFQND